MWAILSDVHGNLEALQAVLADIDRHPVERLYCLGDTLGYGPNPVECLDLVCSRCSVVLLGNHEQATLFDADGFSPSAERAIHHTRVQLEEAGRWDVLTGLLRQHEQAWFLFVHGSPHNPLTEYIFPEDIYNPRKMVRNFVRTKRYAFTGHTHIPGVFLDETAQFDLKTDKVEPGRPESYELRTPEDCASTWLLDGRKTLINVGSVGQPRDGDWRACYVLVDGPVVRFRRIEYDVDRTVSKIYAIPELENFLGDRLREGR